MLMVTQPLPHSSGREKAIRGLQAIAALDEPQVILSPYRLCPLGAHVDHQYGDVLAFALDHGVYLAFQSHDDNMLLASDEFAGNLTISLQSPMSQKNDWGDYARGAYWVLSQAFAEKGALRGMICYSVGGRSQCGLSSSAAIGLAYLKALSICNDIELSQQQLIEYDRQIENEYLGLKNGILDPAAIVFGADQALVHIDTRVRSARLVETKKVDVQADWLAIHSGFKQALTPQNYNSRVEESIEAAQRLIELNGGEPSEQVRLGDVPHEVWQKFKGHLASGLARRAEHFYTETQRVALGVKAWQAGEVEQLGQLMTASSVSSVENYECGSGPVKDLVNIVNSAQHVYGARFCGPGFRGCSVALVEKGCADIVYAQVIDEYAQAHPDLAQESWALLCQPSEGIRLI